MTYQQFKNKWLGKRVDIDKVYGFQCADLVKQYMFECFGIPNGSYGNAIDYWRNTNPKVLAKFDKLSTKETRTGDIVVMSGINGNPYGHIGVADSSAGWIYAGILEQNGATGNGSSVGGDAIRVRNIPKWRVVGVLRPKVARPASKMPAIGSVIRLTKGISRTTFRAGTTTAVGIIRPTDNTSFVYTVRAYDPRYPNRILINSKSAGGDGVALALFYTNGTKIDGWQVK